MEPKELKENFTAQLEKIVKEIDQLRAQLSQRQELALKLQGAIEAMSLQLPEEEIAEGGEAVTEEVPLAETEVA